MHHTCIQLSICFPFDVIPVCYEDTIDDANNVPALGYH